MAETYVDRARVIMARVKNDSSPLNSKISPPIAEKFADAFVAEFGPPPGAVDPENPTEEEKARVYINALREFHRRVIRESKVQAAKEAARVAEEALIRAQMDADIGAVE